MCQKWENRVEIPQPYLRLESALHHSGDVCVRGVVTLPRFYLSQVVFQVHLAQVVVNIIAKGQGRSLWLYEKNIYYYYTTH